VTGYVFHPGHEQLHGVTVVVTGRSGRTYVGRYHERGSRGVVMHDTAVHDPASAELNRDAWLARITKYGVPATEKMLIVPDDEVGEIQRFGGE
jgi:hypothetical protein